MIHDFLNMQHALLSYHSHHFSSNQNCDYNREAEGCIQLIRSVLSEAVLSSDLPHFYSTERDNCYFLTYFFGKGNGTPLQYSCLENPMDGGRAR